MDDQPARGLRRTVSIGPNTRRLQELLARQASGAGERTALTVVGWQSGRTRWVQKVSTGFAVIVMVVGTALLAFKTPFPVTIVVALAVAVAFFAIVQVVARRRGSSSIWEPFGIVLTDRRLLLARESPNGPMLLRDEPAADISWAAVDESEGFWFLSGNPRLTLGGASGPVAAVETPAVSRDTLRARVEDAGLPLVDQSARQ